MSARRSPANSISTEFRPLEPQRCDKGRSSSDELQNQPNSETTAFLNSDRGDDPSEQTVEIQEQVEIGVDG